MISYIEGDRMEFTPDERQPIPLEGKANGDPTDGEAQQVNEGIGGSLTPEELATLEHGVMVDGMRMVRLETPAITSARELARISKIIPRVIAKTGEPAVVALLAEYGVRTVEDLVPDHYGWFLAQCEMMLRQDKSLIEAAHFIADTAPSADYREIAARVADQLDQLENSGMRFELIVAHKGDLIPRPLKESRGLTWRVFRSNVTRVYIQGADVTGYVGMSYQTVLHELIHAVAQAAIYVDSHKPSDGTTIGGLRDELIVLNDAVVAHFRDRLTSGAMLTRFEATVKDELNNSQKNPEEMLAWGLMNLEMQMYLGDIPHKGRSIWDAFVDAIRRFFGLTDKADMALSEILLIGESDLKFPANGYAHLAGRLPMTINQHEGITSNQCFP